MVETLLNKPEVLGSPNKRQRSDSTGDARIRSECWFQDGNVVLQAENTLFRVHQSILSRHSDIFEKIFSDLQLPSKKNELIEGCPVVHVSDTAEDMGQIITLLYDSNKSLKLHKHLNINVLTSMLRLGKKYAITHFKNEALEALHSDYPTTLKDWDGSDQLIQYGDSLDTITQVISIGHELGLLTILPAAYLRYLDNQMLALIAGDNRLPDTARQRCLVGNSRILEHINKENVDAFLPPMIIPSEECSTSRHCEENKWSSIKGLPVWSTNDSSATGLFSEKYPRKATDAMCSQCRKAAINLTKVVRSDFWSILPSFFDLPAWADLKDGV